MAHVCTCMCMRNNERGPSINTYGTLGEAIVFAPRVLYLGDAVTATGILRRWREHLTRSPQRNSDRQVDKETAGGWKSGREQWWLVLNPLGQKALGSAQVFQPPVQHQELPRGSPPPGSAALHQQMFPGIKKITSAPRWAAWQNHVLSICDKVCQGSS